MPNCCKPLDPQAGQPSELRGNGIAIKLTAGWHLVLLELVLVILGEMLRLLILAQNGVPYNKRIHLGTHETAKRVLGRTYNGLATHIKARVDEDGAIGPTLKG